MSNRISSLLCGTLLFFCGGLSQAQHAAQTPPNPEQIKESSTSKLTVPPAGFIWRLYKNVLFLKPDVWKEEQRPSLSKGISSTIYAASPEDFSESKMFEMGITVQIISGSQRLSNTPAKKVTLAALQHIIRNHKREEILMLDISTKGDVEHTILRYRDAPPGLKPIIVHKFFMTNEVTDSVHIFTFESPAESWEENWRKYGTPFLSRVNLLANVPAD